MTPRADDEAALVSQPAVAMSRSAAPFSDLLPRLLSGVMLIALALGTAIAGGASFALLWWAAALVIHWEWQRLLGQDGMALRVGVGSVAITAADAFAMAAHLPWSIICLAIGAATAFVLAGKAARPLAGAGVVYAGLLPLCLDLLRGSTPAGLPSILWLFAVVWGTDIMAYFAGRLIGGPKLWPRLSPSKTWSGFLIGICSGAVAGQLVTGGSHMSGPILFLGILAGAVAQGGDLFESSLKRRFGVKDSSRIIPGHGGVMDRLDGFLAAAVFAACVGALRAGLDAPAAGLLTWS